MLPGHEGTCRVLRSFRLIAVLLAAAGLAWVLGVTPGDSFGVAVDRCFVTYDRLEKRHTRCTGHWTRLGRPVSGPVLGVGAEADWPVLTAEPDADYWWELHVPGPDRHRVALAGLHRAYAVPDLVVIVVGGLAAVTLAVRLLGRLRIAVSKDS